MPSSSRLFAAATFALAAALVALAGCSKAAGPLSLWTQSRPTLELLVAPSKGDTVSYVVDLAWTASDADGSIVGYQYALDPPAMPTAGDDTAWVDTPGTSVRLRVAATRPVEPLPPPGNPPQSRDYHTIVVRAIDDDGLWSRPVARSFTAFTVAPWTNIRFPDPTHQVAIGTPTSFRLAWTGNDPDGSQGPVRYKIRLVTAALVAPVNPEGITAAQVQAFFGADAPGFAAAGWDSVPGDSTGKVLDGLVPGTRYYFAVVAIDESGAYEPRFSLDSNVLQFRPTLDELGPRIRVFNEYFSRLQTVSGVSLNPARTFRFEYPPATALTFNWTALPLQGVQVTGYRWALDIVDIFDETPRSGPDDLAHWSPWSLTTTSATVGPFAPLPGTHVFSVEARDEFNAISLFTIELRIVVPDEDRPLLVIDDLYGRPTQSVSATDPAGPVHLAGAFPMEAEQDSFYVARGGFPDELLIRSGTPGAVSAAGAFADFAPDTLDYRFYPVDGIEYATLARYRAVCWYTDDASAARNGSKFGSASPMTAVRLINSLGRVNTLALYLRSGGDVWLFGEGMTTAMATGYYSRYGILPPEPYTSGDDPQENILSPGNFLYDFCHLRSELSRGGTSVATQLVTCQPFLPANFPLEPGAARTALRWPDLPRLTIAPYRGATASPGLALTWLIHAPNTITGGPPAYESTLDTLFLYEARTADPAHVYAPNDADGYPNAVHYHGEENGPGSQLVWFGFPLHYFERAQVRAVVAAVMRNFGIAPAAARREREARR
jgi:hypothetical protein